MHRVDPGVPSRQPLVLGHLHRDGAGEAQTLHEQLVGELGEPIFHGRIQVADGLEHGEGENAVHHGGGT